MNKTLFATVEQLQDFTGVYPEASNSQQELFLSSASEIISNYLGYNPIKSTRTEDLTGSGDSWLFLGAKPVSSISLLEVNGEKLSQDKISMLESSIYLKSGVFPSGAPIHIQYEAGWEKLPELISLTCLRIAAVLQTEAGDNIGITSKSYGDSGTRTFYNFTNFSKYLSQLSSYQIY